MARTLCWALACCGLAWASPAIGKTPKLVGNWTVNIELSQAVQPKNANARWYEGLGGNFSTSVSVGGIPLPVGGNDPQPEGGGGIPNPDMLRCQSFTIEITGDDMLLTYAEVGTERLRQGHYRGRRNKWTSTHLSTDYESTSRKVTRTLEIQKDGRLLMSVKINPKKGKTRRFKRVFDRT